MPVTFTFAPTNNIGKVRTFIQDTEVSSLLDRVVTSGLWGKKLIFSGGNFEANEFVGQHIFPHTASSYANYKVVENCTSCITVRGDFNRVLPSTFGTSAQINEAIFSDQEITNFLTQSSNDVLKAASIGLRALAANKAKLAKKFKKEGIGGLEIEQRGLLEIIKLAESYDLKANSIPAGGVASMEFGYGKRADEFASNDLDCLGNDLNEYSTQ